MPGFPSAPSVQTVTDKLASLAAPDNPGNVAGYYVYLRDPLVPETIYESAITTDSGGNWSIAGVPAGTYQYAFGIHPNTRYRFQGTYLVLLNPATKVITNSFDLIRDFGAKGDAQFVTDGAMGNGVAVLTSVAGFPGAKANQLISVIDKGAGGTTLNTTILTVNGAGNLTLAASSTHAYTAAYVVWGTDDTAARDAGVAAAIAFNGELVVPAVAVGYMVTTAMAITANTVVRGQGVRSLYGSSTSSGNVQLNVPNIPPYLTGSVFIVASSNVDGVTMAYLNPSLNLFDFGIFFTNWFQNTGHGFNVNPPALAGKQDNGMYDGRWAGLKVFGHDGDHYAYNLLNCLYNVYELLRWWGGGGINLSENNPNSNGKFGNEVFINPYGVKMKAGTGNGYNCTATKSGGINLTVFIRPQCWVQDATALFPGVTAPTNEYLFFADSNVNRQTIILPDMETNTAARIQYPTGIGCTRTEGITGVSSLTQVNPVSGTAYQNLDGTGDIYTYCATLNPTAGAAATCTIFIGATSGTATTQVGFLSAPATGLAGQVQALTFGIPAGFWFKVVLVNATQAWTKVQMVAGA